MLPTVLSFSLHWFEGRTTIVELLWMSFGLGGMYFAIHNFRDSRKDAAALRASGRNGASKALVYTHLRTEAFRMIIHCSTIATGLAASLTMPANPDTPVTVLSLVVLVGLFVINVTTVLQSVLDMRVRRTLEATLLSEEAKDAKLPDA